MNRWSKIVVEPLHRKIETPWPRNVILKEWYRTRIVRDEWAEKIEKNFLAWMFRRKNRRPVKSGKPRDE